ncbi:hypothetical protein CDD81_6786 [Ophiocordyceps australis]|uniref:HEAT repeat protein n=1 Tax=Ophiocordyceps australis TaxID=1399860 RepID=A0A2C5Y206_9HYPO|nr:hypothetical protein CDD81_6786 [Ophiocordyceps australis]
MDASHRLDDDRGKLFQKLKPCCVKISNLLLREPQATHPASQELLQLVNQLIAILNDQINRDASIIDDKLADYIFFPLHNGFKHLDGYSMLLIEACIKCLRILIVYGWKSKISPQLTQQLLSTLTLVIDGVPGSKDKRQVSEETAFEAFATLTALFSVAASSPNAASGLAQQDSIPILGHGVTVMLQGAADGANAQIQTEALNSLQGVYNALREQEALATFLPGTISSLTKMLSTPNRYKSAVITACLNTIKTILTRVLGDMRTRPILAQEKKEADLDDADKKKILSPAWLRATVSQVKLALSTLMKLRTHDAAGVREALERLCVCLLDECHSTLSNCSTMLVETAVILDSPVQDAAFSAQTTLSHLVIIYPELGEAVKTTVYNWTTSIPRIMQLGDDDSKVTAIHNLSKGIKMLQTIGFESAFLGDSISMALRDSTAALVLSSQRLNKQGPQLQLLDGQNSAVSPLSESRFQPILLASESQRGLRSEFGDFFATLGLTSQTSKVAANLMEHARDSESVDQVAATWLCFELVKASNTTSAEADEFLDLSQYDASPQNDNILSDLYSFAVEVLDAHSESSSADWRLEALAMEITAYTAHQSGSAFRPELIDVLFPVAAFLGSHNRGLQQHAVATLNSLALSCEYANVSDLIVGNVDYMVNSVSMRLNTLDISPASMQVLLMMIRLAGPRLIPFLDDVVDSIFSALENFHGYTLFVENLFSVLKEIVDQSSRIEKHILTDKETVKINHKKRKRDETDPLESLAETLDKRDERKRRDAAEDASGKIIKGHPTTPWVSEASDANTAEVDEDNTQTDIARDEQKPAHSPTYQLLLRIAYLTQHYLTSPTPRLRRALLELLTTASSILAADEDSFLPLVNAIWPVVVERLYDHETFITIEACHALSGLCRAAGDFMSSRFQTEWDNKMRSWCRKMKSQAAQSSSGPRLRKGGTSAVSGSASNILIPVRLEDGIQGKTMVVEPHDSSSGSLGQYASPVKVWGAVMELLTSMVSYVRIDADMFDEILDLLSDALEKDAEVRKALENINEDAVWLVRYEKGLIEPLPTPAIEGVMLEAMRPLAQT